MSIHEKRKPGRPRGGPALTRPEATTFGHVVSALGMTHAEAASFLNLSAQTVRHYSTGTRRAPDTVLEKVASLWEQVLFRADPGPLPYAVAKRREALQAVRTRAWRRKTEPEAARRPYDDIDGLE